MEESIRFINEKYGPFSDNKSILKLYEFLKAHPFPIETIWKDFYDREHRETCQNEKERIASVVLRVGGGIGEAVEISGMTWEEWNVFREHSNRWENEHIKGM